MNEIQLCENLFQFSFGGSLGKLKKLAEMFQIIFYISGVLMCCKLALMYPHGAPASRCENLMPSHQGLLSQDSPSPFQIVPSSKTIENGQSMTVEIQSLEIGRPFAGFMLQARTTSDPFVILGQFQERDGPSFNFRDCTTLRSTVTNANNSRSETFGFEWSAPWEFVGKVRFQ